MSLHVPTTEFLSVAEQIALLSAAQDVPVYTTTDEDGEERVTYGKTAASEAAFARLYEAFLPVIAKAARAAKVIDRDEAEGVALAEFVEAVRDFDVTETVPFSATISARLRYAVSLAERTSDIIRVKKSVAAVYRTLMHRHDYNFATAYAEVKIGDTGLAPETFLAVHLIMSGIDSLDPVIAAEDSDSGPRHALASSVASHEERIAREEQVAHLFTLVSDRQQQILRLAYGFSDLATEKIRLAKGYSIGEVMDDGQVAHALDLSRPTAQRDRKKALDVMGRALAAQAAQEIA